MNKYLIAILLFAVFCRPATAHQMKGRPAQDLTPPKQVEMYLDGFHNYKAEMGLSASKQLQVRAAHYCVQHRRDLFQCLVYDGNGKQAKLVGIEYVVPADVYAGFSAEEKQFWHPHDGEVDSGMLRLPGMAPQKERQILTQLRSTYGKTWQLWQTRKGDQFPLGMPQLMWSIDPKQINNSTKQLMQKRTNNPAF